MNKLKKALALLLVCVFLVGILAGCGADSEKSYENLEDFATAKIGILTGSSQEGIVKERFPDAERVYFNTPADLLLAVEQEKIDGYMLGSTFLAAALWENVAVKRVEEAVSTGEIAYAFPQKEESYPLRQELDEFIKLCREDGTLDRLTEKWLGETEPTEHPDYEALSGENGTIRLAVSSSGKPMIYKYKNQYTGYEMELLTLFGQHYGYNFVMEDVPLDSVVMGLSTGKYDIAASSLQITAEREQSVDFSEPHSSFDVVMVVKDRKKAVSQEKGEEDKLEPEEFSTAKIGIITGSANDGIVKHYFPEAQRVYFNSYADMVLAVEQGKIDCYVEDAPYYVAAVWEGANIKRVEEPLTTMPCGFVFSKTEEGQRLREEANAFLAEAKADGTIDRLKDKWMGETEPTEHPDYMSLSGENGTIRLAVCQDGKPMLYKYEEQSTGFEIDLLTLFAEKHGYAFEIDVLPFESLLAGAATGRYDIVSSGLAITPERQESMSFSDPYTNVDVMLVTRSDDGSSSKATKSLSDFENATLGIMTGSVYKKYADELLPNAEQKFYSLMTDLLLATEQGKLDAFIAEDTYVTAIAWEGVNIEVVEEPIAQTEAGYLFRKGDEESNHLRQQMNTFLSESKENGLLKDLREKWFGKAEPTEHPNMDELTGENGTIHVAIAVDLKPVAYIKDGEPSGYEVEVLWHFAKEYGYDLEFSIMSFDGILSGVAVGKYDIGMGATTITEERAQSVDFSESYLTVNVVLAYHAETGGAQFDFWDEVKEDFEKTFIREDRWKMIVEGIGVTMLISISAAIGGSLLGFGLYMLSCSDTRLLRALSKGIAKVYSRIIAGTPVVVVLMILFYVVFGKVRDISGVLVAIIGFTLTFGAFVYSHMTVAVNSVDPGQTEAAYALGYTKNKTFFRIVFPQAMTVFLPSYCGQAVELIKATAVVGYVAVNDLTKMGDIIRSNTYEAFFPLIATAIIYFMLTWGLSLLLRLLKNHYEPKRRSKEQILKGVKTQ